MKIKSEQGNQLDKLTLKSARIVSFSRNEKTGKAVFASSMTQQIRAAMGWEDIPESCTGASMDGELAATVAQITPKESELQRHAIDLDISWCGKFEVVRLELEGKNGKGHRQELRCSVEFADPKGARKLEEYMLTANSGKSTIGISYTKQAVQETIPEVGAAADDGQEAMEMESA